MAAGTRSRKEVKGKDLILAVKKPGGTDFIPIGCAEDITIKSAKSSTKYSCRSGTGTLPSGEDPDWSISLKGFYFVYPSGEKATNVGMDEMIGWHLDESVLLVKFLSNYAGDMAITGPVFVGNWEIGAPNNGLATYNIEMPGAGVYTQSAVS